MLRGERSSNHESTRMDTNVSTVEAPANHTNRRESERQKSVPDFVCPGNRLLSHRSAIWVEADLR